MNKIIRRVTSGLTALAISMIPVNAPIPFVGTNVSVMTASAEETYGDYSYTINEDSDGEYVTITGYSGSDTTVVIPSKIKGLPVKVIGGSSFKNTKISSIKIPEGVTSIGGWAFLGCWNLESVSIPDTVKNIGSLCFYNCSKLKEIVIPGSVNTITEQSFYGCTSLKSIEFKSGVKEIGKDVFDGCTLLTDVSIPDTVTKIDEKAFNNCTSLESITIPDSVEEIGASIFYGCTSLAKVKLSNNINTIPVNAFFNCVSLKEITIPYYVESIGGSAFIYKNKSGYYYSIDIEKINIGAKLKSLKNLPVNSETLQEINVDTKNGFFSSDDGVLYNKDKSQLIKYPSAKADTVFTVPDTVEQISENAFANNTVLKTVYISENTKAIEPKAFYNCTHLDEVYFYNKDCEIYMSKDTINSSAVINGYKDSTAEEYANTYGFAFNEIQGAETTTSASETTSTTTTTTTATTSETTTTSTRTSSATTTTSTTSTSVITTTWIMASIKILSLPNRLEYMEGEEIDYTGGYVEYERTHEGASHYSKTVPMDSSEIYHNVWGNTVILGVSGDTPPSYYSINSATATATFTINTIPTTTTTTTTTAAPTTTSQQPTTSLSKGDVTGDSIIDGRDASSILTYYAQMSTAQIGSFNEYQIQAADVNGDNIIDARDASLALTFYAYTSTGHSMTLDEYISEMNNPTTSATTTTVTTTTTSTTTETTTTTTTANTAWKQLYLNAATSYESSNSGSVYKLIDLNGDGIPELYARNLNQGGALWTVVNDKIMQLKKWDNARTGSITNYSETNHTFVTLSTLSDLYYEYAIWSLSDNGDMLKKKAFTCNNGKFAIDYVSTTQDQYNSVMNAEVVSQTSVYSTSNDLSISKLRSRLR